MKPKQQDTVDLRFLTYVLNSLTPIHVNIAMGNPKLMNRVFENISVPLPSFSEQKRIASFLVEKTKTVAKMVKIIEQELETINALPAAILRHAFSGGL